MNSVIIAVMAMVLLSLVRVNIVIALIIGAIVGGLTAGLDINETIKAFNAGLGDGATIALSYAMLGTFAVAISKSGITDLLSNMIIKKVGNSSSSMQFIYIKYLMLTLILLAAISSQNLIPVHIAFIPILIPPLLHSMSELKLDRRVVACVITFGLVATYMLLPIGFGGIFLNEILLKNLVDNGVEALSAQLPIAMSIPVLGMFLGLLTAMFFTYRKKRVYNVDMILESESQKNEINSFYIVIALASIVTALGLQLYTKSIILGSLAGFIIFIVAGVIKANQTQDFFTKGLKMMGMIGFIMIAANGFANVINETGGVETLVASISDLIGENKSLAVFLMLIVGLFITMGIGSSFSTIPIIATIYAPLCMQMDFSAMATITIIGTAAALGDAGSPASDSTLGPTSGLNVDGQHDHIWDTVVPTFIHYNIPLILFGWFAAVYVF